MHEVHVDLIPLLVLLAGSFLMPVLSGRIRVPSAVLLIGFGIAVGPELSGLVPDSPVVLFLYEVGFIVLMFLAGLEIDFNQIRGSVSLAKNSYAGQIGFRQRAARAAQNIQNIRDSLETIFTGFFSY